MGSGARGDDQVDTAPLALHDGVMAWATRTSDIVGLTDDAGAVVWLNESGWRRLAKSPGDAITTADLLPPSAFALYFDEIRPVVLAGGAWSGELTVLSAAGPFEAWVTVVGGVGAGGDVDWLMVVARDLTDLRTVQRELGHLATHDELTGLANRALLGTALERALARAVRDGTTLAIVYVDLDGLKGVNDTLGHAAGDVLLREAGRRMARSVRPSDLVARVGGDEFVLLLEGLGTREEALDVAGRVRLALEADPVRTGGLAVPLSASFGVAWGRGGDVTGDVLLQRADTAMYEAKLDRSRAIAVYDDHLHERELHRAALGDELAIAITQRRVRPHYLSVVEVVRGRRVGWHALARWDHPERGILDADEFVDAVAGAGAATALDLAILREAALGASGLPGQPRPRIDVSVSARSLAEPGFAELVHEVLEVTPLTRGQLGIRMPEAVLARDVAPVARTLTTLRELDVRLAAGGVGLGALAVRSIVDVGVTEFVLARDLVAGLPLTGHEVIAGVIGLAHGLGLPTTAVGVATSDQLASLADLGCDLAEGHHFGAPTADAGAA
jgi:diguanylate cyclase (GGDEF)-like protein